MRTDDELKRLVETLSQHLGEQIRKEQENPALEKASNQRCSRSSD
jgi:hypothetical protein